MPVADEFMQANQEYAATFTKGDLAAPPARRVVVVTCMDARLDVEDLLGLQTGEAHVIRNAGGVVTEDALRSLVISHHLLDTLEFILIHHTRCGMLAFTDDLLKAGLEGDPAHAKTWTGSASPRSTGTFTRVRSPRGLKRLRALRVPRQTNPEG